MCVRCIDSDVGKMRQANCGTDGYIPLENMGQEVISDGSQDGFALGIVLDAIFLETWRFEDDDFYVSFHGKPMRDVCVCG